MHYCLTDFVLEIVHNAYEAKAKKIDVQIIEDDALTIIVRDNGAGMTTAQVQHALDPFYTADGKHDKRRVGLGLPFVKQITEMTGGSFEMNSIVNQGTTVRFSVPLQHIDCPPLGNVAEGLASLIMYAAEAEVMVLRKKQNKQYQLLRSELIEALGGFETALEANLLRDFIKSQEISI